jgi:hypothetical protein
MSRDYREKTIKGCVFELKKKLVYVPKMCNVIVRMTSDDVGQSLSLQTNDVMIQIPLEQVADIIKIAEKE